MRSCLEASRPVPNFCDGVPGAVRAAFEKAYPKATVNACAQEVEAGETVYEIASKEGGTGRDVLFRADGGLILVEETVALGDVPEPRFPPAGARTLEL